MKLTPINCAEAVFEAFHDPEISEFAEWTVESAGVRGFKVWQNWIWVQWSWETPGEDGEVIHLRRALDLDCSGYDRVIVCVAMPEESTVSLEAETDSGRRFRRGDPFGPVKREEWLPLDGARRITSLSIRAFFPKKATGNGWIYWMALQSTDRLPAHLARWSGYDEQWAKYLQPPGFVPSFRPVHGLLLNADELEAVRREFAHTPAADALREAAADARAVRPEDLIGQFVNMWNSNSLRRERDHGKVITIHGANAAQAGMLLKDRELCRLAARFAISIAHCERWDDCFVCYMPGSSWEQRSFVQSVCVFETALILDLCGEWFTEVGRNLVLRRIAEEGLGNLNFNTWWWEYIFHCNQLTWFAPGRILGYLLLERTMPARCADHPPPETSRVAPYTELAVKDLLENLQHILLPDGGYVEGPTYFTWVIRQAIVSLHLYARARGRGLAEVVPAQVKSTAVMAEVLYSTDDRQDMILICDAMYAFPEGLAYLAAYLPDSHWVTIYRKQMARAGAAPSLLAMSLSAGIPESGPALQPFVDMPETGMMCSVRRLQGEVVKLFLMGNRAGAGHTHEDKGSFVLEFAGDTFAQDFGVVDYSNPLTESLKHAQRHNMLTPLATDERPCPARPILSPIRAVGTGDETRFRATMDVSPGWEGWFRKWERTWESTTPGELVIVDEWAVEKGEGVVFHWTTTLPMKRDGDTIMIEGRRGIVEITIPPGTEAILEDLPLMNPERRAIDELRREIVRFGLTHAETQPRLRVIQRGREGALRIGVRLRLKP